ncbi:MAG TPA: DUF2231 domain-containing protein [Aliidongia sp.]|nr:DUF2231 domain-containing protein [Aliidongia sp.]
MHHDNPPSTARLAGHPIHAMLVPFPIACFVGTFITDLAYWRTAAVMWETFSIWLLAAGLIMGGFAALAGLVDLFGSRRTRALPVAWLHMLGNLLILGLSLINAFVHSRDGYTAVVPTGIVLSGLVVLLLLFTGWMGGTMVYRHRVGVAN